MWALLQHELKYYFKNKVEAIYLYSYFISIVVLVPFTLKDELAKLQSLANLTLWIALASAVAIGASGLFGRDHEQGRLEYYQLLPVPLELLVFTKWLGFYLFLLVPLLAALPVAGLLFAIPGGAIPYYAVGLAAGAAALSILSATVAALTTGLEKAGAVLSLIILPLTIPVMIFGTEFCRKIPQFSQGLGQISHDIASISYENLIFLLGFSLFLLPVMCFAGAYSIRSSN